MGTVNAIPVPGLLRSPHTRWSSAMMASTRSSWTTLKIVRFSGRVRAIGIWSRAKSGMSGPSRIPMRQTNKVDIVVSTLSITPARAKVIDFSIPYADHPSVVAGLKTVQIKSLADLDGKKVAVVRGTTQDTDLTKQAKGAQLVRYEDDATMALAVASGQVDILATARSLLPAISKKNPARTVEPKITMQTNWLAIGVRTSDVDPRAGAYAWTGLISQAGITLGLASVLATEFPAWGGRVQMLLVALIAIDELLGPTVFRTGLAQAGELRQHVGHGTAGLAGGHSVCRDGGLGRYRRRSAGADHRHAGDRLRDVRRHRDAP